MDKKLFISNELVEFLKETFPEVTWRTDDKIQDLSFRSGAREVVNFIAALYDKQENKLDKLKNDIKKSDYYDELVNDIKTTCLFYGE